MALRWITSLWLPTVAVGVGSGMVISSPSSCAAGSGCGGGKPAFKAMLCNMQWHVV